MRKTQRQVEERGDKEPEYLVE